MIASFMLLAAMFGMIAAMYTAAFQLANKGNDWAYGFLLIGTAVGFAFLGMFNKFMDKVF